MKERTKATKKIPGKEAQDHGLRDLIKLTHDASEKLRVEPLKSVTATVLQINGRIITLRVPSAHFVELEGRDIEINGLNAVWVRSIPSSEAEDDKIDVTNALLFKVARQVVPKSLKVARVCEVTWE